MADHPPRPNPKPRRLRTRSRLGKYRIEGCLAEYPFTWPPQRHDRLRRKAHPDFIALIRKSLEMAPRRRFRDACAFHAAYLRIRRKALL